jgi:hypothetical protein
VDDDDGEPLELDVALRTLALGLYTTLLFIALEIDEYKERTCECQTFWNALGNILLYGWPLVVPLAVFLKGPFGFHNKAFVVMMGLAVVVMGTLTFNWLTWFRYDSP